MRTARSRTAAILIALVAAATFVAVASIHLGRQGAYYDELHQATGAFTWTGSRPEMFCYVAVGRWCLFNMSYSAAIKTNLYGGYLRLTGAGFKLVHWRFLGILFVPIGLMAFAALASRTLAPAAVAIVCLFSILDMSILVMARFDWGPVALGTALRFIMLGVWLSTRSTDTHVGPARFAIGMLAGIATTEKLSSIVLIPVAFVLSRDVRAGARSRAVRATVLGLSLGLFPLLVANLYWLWAHGHLVSLVDVSGSRPWSWSALAPFFKAYARLGQGGLARSFTLGGTSSEQLASLETGFMVAASLLIVGSTLASRPKGGESLERATRCILTYWLIGLELFLLPKETMPHHWIIGTPFQYVAIALWAQGLFTRPVGTARPTAIRLGVAAIVIAWLGIRMPTVTQTIADLRAGVSAPGFDPAFSTLGRFASRKADEAVFVAASWGVATQIYCFSGGRADLVHEIFWGNYRGIDQIDWIWQASQKRELYFVRREIAASRAPEVPRRVEADMLADPRWKPIPVPSELTQSPHLVVLGFIRKE